MSFNHRGLVEAWLAQSHADRVQALAEDGSIAESVREMLAIRPSFIEPKRVHGHESQCEAALLKRTPAGTRIACTDCAGCEECLCPSVEGIDMSHEALVARRGS